MESTHIPTKTQLFERTAQVSDNHQDTLRERQAKTKSHTSNRLTNRDPLTQRHHKYTNKGIKAHTNIITNAT